MSTLSPRPLTETEDLSKPAGWGKSRLRELCVRTGSLDPVKIPEREFEYVDVSSVSAERLRVVRTTKVKGASAPSRARKLLRTGDVIFATVRPTLRRVACVPPSLDGQLASTAFCVIRANPDVADPRFLYYAAMTDGFVQGVGALERGASYPAVTDGDVLDQEILVPPFPEQRAIAGVLSKLQAAVEVQDRTVATLKELKAATMAKLFREGLHGEPLKPTDIGEIPASWDVVSLGAIAKVRGSTVAFADIQGYESQAEDASRVIALKVSDMNLPGNETRLQASAIEFCAKSDFLERYAVPRGSVVFPKRGAAIATNKKRLTALPAILDPNLIAVTPGPRIDTEFFFQWIGTFNLATLQEPGAVPQLNKKNVDPVLVPLPKDLRDQRQIGESLHLLDCRTAIAQKRLLFLQSLFSSLLSELITGRLRLQPATSRPEGGHERSFPMATEEWAGRVPESTLAEIVRRIVEAVAPEKIILFGSAARGDMGPDSDLDLLIIKSRIHRRATAQAIERSLVGIPLPTDIIVATPEDVARHRSTIGRIYGPALSEGRVLYAA